MKLSICAFFLLVITLGCNPMRPQYGEIVTQPSNQSIRYKFTKLEINSLLPSFDLFDFSASDNDCYLVFFDFSSTSFEIIDLNENQSVLRKDFNHLIGDVAEFGDLNSIEFLNFDSIFILQNHLLSLVDTSQVIFSKPINMDGNEYYKNLMLMNLDHAPIYFEKMSKHLSIQSYCRTCYVYDRSYYIAPVNVALSINDFNVKELPVRFPERYLKNYYGFHNIVFRSEYSDRYLVGFSAEPNIFLYDKSLDEVIVAGGRSKYQLNDISAFPKKHRKDSNRRLKHITLEPLYKEIFYDEYRDIYYRFLLNGIREKNPDGTYNAWRDKELILMVFDSSLKLIDEINLNSGVYNSTKSFVAPKGLYLYNFKNREDSENKNKIYYDVFEIY